MDGLANRLPDRQMYGLIHVGNGGMNGLIHEGMNGWISEETA